MKNRTNFLDLPPTPAAHLTNSEIEEMESATADFPQPSTEDWDFYHEVSYSDPFDTISGL